VCRDLSDKIADFLKNKWEDTFNFTLGARGLLKDWHQPRAVDKNYCDST
jgi:hypothetical protein